MRTHSLLSLCLLIVLPACTQPVSTATEREPLTTSTTLMTASWPTFQGSTQHDGARSIDPILKPTIAWSARVGIQGWLNNPLLVGDMVITSSQGETWNVADKADGVIALEAATGKQRWFARAKTDVNGIAYASNTIIATGDEGAVWALDAATGEQLWYKDNDGVKLYATPLLLQGIAVVADARGVLSALDMRTGATRWSVQLNEEVRNGLASDGETIYVATMHSGVMAFDLKGKLLWRSFIVEGDIVTQTDKLSESFEPIRPEQQRPAFWAAPTIAGNLLVLTYVRDTTYDTPAILALNRVTGTLAWSGDSTGLQQNNQWGNIRSSPALVHDALYWAEPYSREVAGMELATGKLRFRSQMGACTFPQWGSPAASNDLIYVPRFDGTLWAIAPMLGLVEWQVYLGDKARAGQPYPDTLKKRAPDQCDWEISGVHGLYASPTIGPDDSIYQGSGDGWLYKLIESAPSAP
jgi:outer membrane protein assembly factor BamB